MSLRDTMPTKKEELYKAVEEVFKVIISDSTTNWREPFETLNFLQCDSCGLKNPRHRCTSCKAAYYCSRDCQKNHWKDHKMNCKFMAAQIKGFAAGDTKFTGASPHEAEKKEEAKAINTTCPICLEESMVGPTILDCGHAFCFLCVQSHQANRQTFVSGPLPCPICRANVGNVNQQIESKMFDLALRSANADATPEEARMWRDRLVDEANKVLGHEELTVTDLFRNDKIILTALSNKVQVLTDSIERGETDVIDDLRSAADLMSDLFDKILKSGKTWLNGFQFYMDLAAALLALNEVEAAVEVIFQIPERFPNSESETSDLIKYLMLQQEAFYRSQRYTHAIQVSNKMVSVFRFHPHCHKNLVRSYDALGQKEEALRALQQSIMYEAPWDESHRKELLTTYMMFLVKYSPASDESSVSSA